MNIVQKQYGPQVRQEVLGEKIQSSLFQALQQEKINPAGMPNIEETDFEEGKPLTFTAVFEVYPEVKLKPFTKVKVEKTMAKVTDADINKTLDVIRGQQKDWVVVERAGKEGDQVDIDFVGSIDGEEFEGGKAEHFSLDLGDKKMIPGFEDGIMGMKAGEEKVIDVKFPKEYGAENLAGKKSQFAIKVHAVKEAQLPELNDAFAEKLGIKEGGLAKLEEEVSKNMQRELEQALKSKVKHQVMDALYEQNKLELPKALIDQEIEHLKKQAEERYGEQMAQEGVAEQSADYFEKEAQRRVALGLLLSEIIKKNEIKADDKRVREMIESVAESYQKPEDVVAMYYNDKQRLAQIESLILEEQVVELIMDSAKVTEKKAAFEDIIKPQN
jgi:trigger factor